MHKFAAETFTPALVRECVEMIQAHHLEVSDLSFARLDPDFQKYTTLDASGLLRIFSVRTQEGTLIGYDVFIVNTMLHHKTFRAANQDMVYLEPGFRHIGLGREFMRWVDDALKAEGIDLISRTLKPAGDYTNAMAGEGYRVGEITFVKQLTAMQGEIHPGNGADHEAA